MQISSDNFQRIFDSTHEPKDLVKFRRTSYGARFYEAEYFILKHVERFIAGSLNRYVRGGDKVCDIGCGEQPLRKHIESLGASYCGLDITQNSSGTVDIVGGITNIPVCNNWYDVVICTEVLEHVSDTLSAFREISRIVKPEGNVIITTPFSYRLHEEPYDFVRLTPYQIHECAKRNGLVISELATSGNELEIAASLVEYRLGASAQTFARKKLTLLSRLLLNAFVMTCNATGTTSGTGKYFFSTMCVLRKQGAL